MDDSDAVLPAVAETVGFLAYFKDLADPRQQGKVTYPLEEILLLCLMAVLAGAISPRSPCLQQTASRLGRTGHAFPSWPGLSGLSVAALAGGDGPDKPGHDEQNT